jgi:hypothetical protein
LVLLSATKGAEAPGSTVEASSLSAGPAEVRGAGINQAKRVVASVVEADGDGVGRKRADPRVLQGTRYTIDVDLKRDLADLRTRLIQVRKIYVATYSVQLCVIIGEGGGKLRVPPLVVRSGNENTALQSDGISIEWAVQRILACSTGIINAEVEELGALGLGFPGAFAAGLVLVFVTIFVIMLVGAVGVHGVGVGRGLRRLGGLVVFTREDGRSASQAKETECQEVGLHLVMSECEVVSKGTW